MAGAAEISVTDGNKIKVHRIVAATDPGYAVNPAQIERQIAGSFVYGLSGLFYGGCTVKDGKIIRIRPMHYDWKYKKEDLNPWKMEVRGSTFEPSMKTLIPPYSLAYKKRVYSPARIRYPMMRVDFDPDGERSVLAQKDHPVDESPDLFGLRLGRLHSLVAEDRQGEVTEHRLAMRRLPAELPLMYLVRHYC